MIKLSHAILLLAAVAVHQGLRSSSPADGDRLTEAPREIRLLFLQDLQPGYTRVELIGPDGAPVALGPLRLPADSPRLAIAPITGALSAGEYTVVWRAVGDDGHPVTSDFGFTIAEDARGLGPPPGAVGTGAAGAGADTAGAAGAAGPGDPATAADTAAPGASGDGAAGGPDGRGTGSLAAASAFDAESPLYAAVRWVGFLALLGTLGAIAFRGVLWSLRRQSPGTEGLVRPAARAGARLGLWMAAALLVAAVLRLVAQSAALHGPADALRPELVARMVANTGWGLAWILQVVAALLALAGFAAARRGRTAGWWVAAVAAVGLAVAPGLSGHAAGAGDLAPVAVAAHTAHLVGAGGWLGSLLLVLLVGVPACLRHAGGDRLGATAALVNAFSPTALFFGGMTLLSGLFAAWIHVGSVTELWGSEYGRTLLVKVALLTGVFGTAAYNWLRVRPVLAAGDGAARLRRSATVELLIGVLVLAVTAVLVATPTPGHG